MRANNDNVARNDDSPACGPTGAMHDVGDLTTVRRRRYTIGSESWLDDDEAQQPVWLGLWHLAGFEIVIIYPVIGRYLLWHEVGRCSNGVSVPDNNEANADSVIDEACRDMKPAVRLISRF